MVTTMSALGKARERYVKEVRELELRAAVLEVLPDNISVGPSVSNISDTDKIRAWLSFASPAYDPQGSWDPIQVLRSLELGGFELYPASLCQYGSYRRSPKPGLVDDVPETSSRAELTDVDPIVPMWVNPCQYTPADAVCYMRRGPGSNIYRVSVDLPRSLGVRVHAQRKEFSGGWMFVSGSARLSYPEHWRELVQAGLSKHTRADVDTEQGCSGSIYFRSYCAQNEWKMLASDFLWELTRPLEKG